MGGSLSKLVNEHKLLSAAVVLGCATGDVKDDFLREFLGMILAVGTQFPAGKWIATGSWQETWAYLAAAIVGTDWLAGGPNINPAVALYLYALGEINAKQCISRSAAAFAGATVAFPLFDFVATRFKLPPLGGPLYNSARVPVWDAFMDETAATAGLCFMIAAVSWELPSWVRDNYLIKMLVVTAVIRALIEKYPKVGPCMNPAIGVAYASHYRGGQYPSTLDQYAVLCGAPTAGALGAALLYAYWTDRNVLGVAARTLLGGKKKLV